MTKSVSSLLVGAAIERGRSAGVSVPLLSFFPTTPVEAISESTRRHFNTGEAGDGYGYLWWLAELPVGDGGENVVVANGWGSQFIVIFPGLSMVVVTTGGNEDNGRHLDLSGVLIRTLLAAM